YLKRTIGTILLGAGLRTAVLFGGAACTAISGASIPAASKSAARRLVGNGARTGSEWVMAISFERSEPGGTKAAYEGVTERWAESFSRELQPLSPARDPRRQHLALLGHAILWKGIRARRRCRRHRTNPALSRVIQVAAAHAASSRGRSSCSRGRRG